MEKKLENGLKIKNVKAVDELLYILNNPSIKKNKRGSCHTIDVIDIDGCISLSTMHTNCLISDYRGEFRIYYNVDAESERWFNVQSLVKGSHYKIPMFSTQFQWVDKFIHVPYSPIASYPTNYIKAPVRIGGRDTKDFPVEVHLYLCREKINGLK